MVRRRKDLATVSFHFLQREKGDAEPRSVVPFTLLEFQQLCSNVENQPWPDISDIETKNRVGAGALVPFRNFKRESDRLVFGTFQTAYTGVAYHNSDKGKIPADSLNQREFLYMLYLSENGQIFVGAQYLGNYGGYETLRWGLFRHLPSRAGARSYSFRKEVYDAKLVKPKEIRVNIAAIGRDDEDNVLTRRRMVVLQRNGVLDGAFEDAARDQFLPIMASDSDDKKDRLVQIMSDNHLMSADDEDIENCIMLANIDGREKRLHVFGENHFATRFPLSVPYNSDGHPEFDPTVAAMRRALENNIISPLS